MIVGGVGQTIGNASYPVGGFSKVAAAVSAILLLMIRAMGNYGGMR